MTNFKFGKELIKALYKIRDAIKGESIDFSWLDVIKVVTPGLEEEPLYIVGTDIDGNLDLNTIQRLKDVSAYETLKCFQREINWGYESSLSGIFLFDKKLIKNGNCYIALTLDDPTTINEIYAYVTEFNNVIEKTIELEGKTYYYYTD